MYQGRFNNAEKAARRDAPRKKRRMTKGGKIFYCCLLAFVLIFFIALTFVMGALKDWLVSFEASQPTTKANEVFQQVFAEPDWQRIYELSGEKDTEYINKAKYAAYMEKLAGDQDINYIETSAGLSGDKKYIVRAGTTRVASFTLTKADPNAEIPVWELSDVELFFNRSEFAPAPETPVQVMDYSVVTIPGYVVTANGAALEETDIVRTVSTKAESYLPEDVHGYRLVEYRISGLKEKPEVTITDVEGNALELSYDEKAGTFSHDIGSAEIGDTERDAMVNAATAYCEYMIGKNKGNLRKHFDSSKETYSTITKNETWMQSYASYKVGEATVTEYYRYSEKLFSARIELTMNVTRKDGTVKEYPLDTTFFVEKQGDNWKVIEMTNVDVQEQSTMVRLTYIQDDTVLYTEMVQADSKSITTPEVTIPEGKTFAGWFIKSVDAEGNTTMSLAFVPGEDNTVTLGADLEPMTLHAWFEEAEA